jgi:rubrerythrin
MNARDVILDILRKAYLVEVDGYTFYSMTAEKAEKEAVRELFEKLAQDEVVHQTYLKEAARRYDDKGTAAFGVVHLRQPDIASFADRMFSDRFRAQAQGATFELGVLSIGMQLEAKAIELFANAASGAADATVRGFYEHLAEWERQHLAALTRLHSAVRSDLWEHAGFAPF